MRRAVRAWCVVTALALSVVGPGALVAAGDDGPSVPFPTGRPIRSILRPTEIVARTPQPSDKTVVLFVSTFCVLPALLVVFLGPPLMSLVG